MGDPRSIETLLAVMNALRTPETGCPWDLEQDFSSIAPYTIEEAYEVADAIERLNMEDLCDELGDLQLQVVYHARLADEAGSFSFGDVIEAIVTKMIRRHPHVFGDAEGVKSVAVKGMWEGIKASERSARTEGGGDTSSSLLADIPVALPGLTRAVKLQSRAARVGFDWPNLEPVFAKVEEEIVELKDAVAEGTDKAHIAEELGDLLFVIANIARHLEINPEGALRSANAKFIRRFNHIEQSVKASGQELETVGLDGLDRLWDEAKSKGL
ncbi:nucleoside triphosphate pyrophosphohydrolase [Rhodoligotrophos appendicifer]|uniref:nucleoside triphosphate pyrophosphohydrolase n=1 Tax=Rhodoligotrophos appendicifer TaxID=987056 RepID=UPI001186ACED|nr:nucleoside triphosphate pyrophosphohydrolase [Rhodoligotrophos appendicifer]